MKRLFYLSCLIAAVAPLLRVPPPLPPPETEAAAPVPFLALDGETPETPLFFRETPLITRFPGKIRVATSGGSHVLIREVAAPTRALHSSLDCFRGSGYRVGVPRVERDAMGRSWSVFTARRGGREWKVFEVFVNAAGESWTDVSSWYWSAWFHPSEGPWQAVTRVETL